MLPRQILEYNGCKQFVGQSQVEKHLLTVKELATILNVAESWVYERTRQGQEAIPFIRLGAYVRFDPEEVINFFKLKKN